MRRPLEKKIWKKIRRTIFRRKKIRRKIPTEKKIRRKNVRQTFFAKHISAENNPPCGRVVVPQDHSNKKNKKNKQKKTLKTFGTAKKCSLAANIFCHRETIFFGRERLLSLRKRFSLAAKSICYREKHFLWPLGWKFHSKSAIPLENYDLSINDIVL